MDKFIIENECEIHHGDSIEVMPRLKENSMSLAVFSPPFSSLFAYSSNIEDIGNSRESDDEFLLHYEFSIPPLFDLIKPGCNVCVHVADVPRLKESHGYVGAYDLSGEIIKLMEKYGFYYYRRWTVNKNPQSQSIRNHSITLTFAQFEKDSRQSSAALADYILVFKNKKAGKAVPVIPQMTRDEWIECANPTWYGIHENKDWGIKETDTLNTRKSEGDMVHICPLQLGLISRLVRLYSNEGETVFTPFMGIGSEVYQSLLLKRKAVGIELKDEWFNQSVVNAKRAIYKRDAQGELAL